MPDLLELRLDSISVTGAGFIVFLKADGETRVLPIFIGANEAQAIALALGEEPPPRPLTHDLLKNMLDALDATVTRIDITDLKDGTFFAKVHVMRDAIEGYELDARPSDAIALAVRYDAPIFVVRAVFDEAAITVVVKSSMEDDESGAPSEIPEASEVAEDVESYELSEADDDDARDPEPAVPEPPSPPLTPLEKLRADLQSAVRDERYEEAARLRDVLKRMGDN
jgi:bifunctional DNase/RNase